MGDPPLEHQITSEYRDKRRLYSAFGTMLSAVLSQIARDRGVALHSVTDRPKELESLARKLSQPGHSYQSLTDLTDLAGVRIITYFHDHVDLVATLVEREFAIDRENSVDKRSLLDPDRFGYMSLHFVVQLSEARAQLPEHRRFAGLKAEIQVRSLLQHVWAEINHDLGYKTGRSVPSAIRRRFARLAGMLEIADAEFVAIRNELAAYETEVPQRIREEPATVPLDQASLSAYLGSSELVRRLDSQIAAAVSAAIRQTETDRIDRYLRHLDFLGVRTVGQLGAALLAHEREVVRFAEDWLAGLRYEFLAQGICMLYLTYVLLAKQHDRARIMEWATKNNVGLAKDRADLVEHVITTANKLQISAEKSVSSATAAKSRPDRS